MKKIILFLIVIFAFLSCKKDNVNVVNNTSKSVITSKLINKDQSTTRLGSMACKWTQKNGTVIFGKKCIYNNGGDCKKLSECKVTTSIMQDMIEARGITTLDQWENYDISQDHEMLQLLYDEDPTTFCHPDSIPYDPPRE